MAFFLSTNGSIHPYNFKYLEGEFEKARMERTEIHSEFSRKMPRTLPAEQLDFFAIDVMKRSVISMDTTAPLQEIREKMKKHSIRHIPIVHEHKIKGIISDRDMLRVDLAGTFHFLKAEDIMTTVLILAEEETPLAHLARVLVEEKISALPIIDKAQNLTGIISRTDILQAIVYNRLVLK
ncbi:MAG: CBS domain-containing protein [Bacteriovorax sp.]|jgi:CBS domain-containing protein